MSSVNAQSGHKTSVSGCPATARNILVGGMMKVELLQELLRKGIQLNEAAQTLFASELFVTAERRMPIQTVELTAGNLGFPLGATWTAICRKAGDLGLNLCPLETAAHFRLQFLDQAEGEADEPSRQHRAPSGSITVASEAHSGDDDFPKGFYLRRMHGVLWLRGYRSSASHVWDRDDHLLFRRP